MNAESPARRSYRMVARAESAAATAERILDATVEVFWELPTDQISLDRIARRAGVSVQTVIRRFGSRDALFAAAVERQSGRVRQQRDEATPGDTADAVRVLLDHYEELGERVLKLLTEEERMPGIGAVTERGRALHREWCERVFQPTLIELDPYERHRRLAQLVAICDVYTWKLLRLDSALSREQTELALTEMLTPLLGRR